MSSPLNRRSFVQGLTAPIAMTCAFQSSALWGTGPIPQDASSKAPLVPLHRFGRMTQEWLVDQIRAKELEAKNNWEAVKTMDQARAYVESCRDRARTIFGPEPERNPLNAKVMKTVEREQYRIENVVFESRPGFWVTANLYLPKGYSEKRPGVVGTCGHSLNGKAAEAYQGFAQGLARQGYVVLIYDPIGQGERFQYLRSDLKSRLNGGVGEHIQMGNQQTLVGEFLGAWFAWDGIRALDYLITRDEVDPRQIAVTGNSGGGTQTTWLCAVEPRWAMAAPACFVTTFRRNVENELPADTEQCPPRAIELGMDHSDFLLAMAPKPLILLAQERDYFDVRGTSEAFERIKKIYTLLGKPENVELFVGPTYHGYTQENREAMYRFFNKHSSNPASGKEPPLTIEADETLWCTPRGTVSDLNSRTVFSYTKDIADSLSAKRPRLGGDDLRRAIETTLRIRRLERSPDYRILRSVGSRSYPAKFYCTYAVETEPRNHAIVTMLSNETWTSRLPQGRQRALLYLSHRSADQELRNEPWTQTLFASDPDATFFACDVRGIGESQPDTCGRDTFDSAYGSDYFQSAHGLMLGRPYLGQRVFDAVRIIEWLAEYGFHSVHLAGKGWGAVVATMAGVLCRTVQKVTLKNGLESFQSVAETEDYVWPYSFMVPGILKSFDLTDCYQDLQSKGLSMIDPWTAVDGKKQS